MKQLAEQIYSEYRRHGCRKWLITTALPGEGGSQIATMLAGALGKMVPGPVCILPLNEVSESRRHEMLANDAESGQFMDEPYELCLIDATGVLSHASVMRFAESADRALMVVRAESSSREVFHESIQMLERRGVKIAGVVLNQRRRRIPSWLYRCL